MFRISQFPPLILLSFAAVFLSGLAELSRVERRLSIDDAEVTGKFEAGGPVPNGSPGPSGLQYWSSWAGSDTQHGALVLGPFRGPSTLTIQIMGYPQMSGNRLYFENTATGESFDPQVANAREKWRRVRIDLPLAWRGAPVLLHAVDDAETWGGWLAITEPQFVPWWAAWWSGIWPILDATLFSGLAAALLFTAAGTLLARWEIFRGPGALCLAGAVTAATGYLVFWLFFAHAATGRAAVAILFGVAAWICAISHRDKANALWRDRDWVLPMLLMAAAMIFYVGLLFLFSAERLIPDVAANRYRENLPGDNDIPRFFADRLRAAESLKPFFGDWLSSDRPPLQTGWILLLAPAARLLGTRLVDGDHIVSFWFQLLWVPAMWWWLRSLGVRMRHAAGVIAVVVPSGFFIINTVYVWPKLGAGAFALGAFVAWFVARIRTESPIASHAVGGGLAALGWLAHGGSGFSLLAVVPFALCDRPLERWRQWTGAAIVFMVLALPWSAYQRFYDPPGNRLLKWHLGGVIPPDDRGTIETIAKSYHDASWGELWRHRVANARMLFRGPWEQFATFDTHDASGRRDHEFFHTFFALGWWNLGFLALAANAIPCMRRRWPPGQLQLAVHSIIWVAATLLLWITLMFSGWNTAIHQGSYTPLLLLFPLLALVLWRMHWIVFGIVGAAQLAALPGIWMSPPPAMSGLPMRYDALLAVVAGLLLVLLIVACSERRAAAPVPPVQS